MDDENGASQDVTVIELKHVADIEVDKRDEWGRIYCEM